MICDPSHIAGRRDLIFDVSQAALDLNFDGLMIETHWDPDNAWSDAAQQVTPSRLVEIMRDLKVRKQTTNEEAYLHSLTNLRAQIDFGSDFVGYYGKKNEGRNGNRDFKEN